MPAPIEPITTAALSAALDAALRSHAASASNIANAGTDGYVPLHLSFDERLEDARSILQRTGRLDGAALEGLRGELAPAGEGAGAVQLDLEMAGLAANAVRFQTLAQALNRHLGLLALAAGDGRR